MAGGIFAESHEVVAQMIYAGILIISSIVAIIMKYFGSRAFVNFYAFQAGCSAEHSSDGAYYLPCAGDQAVYRISFGLVVFYLGMMPLGVISKACHTGFWIIKIPIAIVCVVGPFFIPNEFFNVFFKVAYPFAALYLIIQMLVIVGFAYDAHEYLVKKMDAHDEAADEDNPNCCNIWKVLYLGACIVAVLGIVAGIIYMFVRFSCAVPYIMISISVVIAVVLIVLAVMEKLGQGLLVGVVIAGYATYLTWSALSSYPNPQKEMWKLVDGKNKTYWVDTETCNPFLCDPTSETAACGMWMMILGIVFSAISVGWTGWRVGLSSTRIFKDNDEDKDEDENDSSLLDKKKKKKSYGSRSKTKADQDKLDKVLTGEADADDDADLEEDDFDEHDGHKKSKKCCGCKDQAGRLFFYVVMDLACWYMAMLLTNWSNSKLDQTHSQQVGVGYTSMMVQFGAQWFMLAVYLWTILAPSICSCRDFS